MVKIHRLKRPMKTSGFKLEAGKKTTVRNVTIVNQNSFPVWVDKFTRKPPKKKKKAKAKKR